MDTSLLSSHCIELLCTHNRVSLGSLGSFIAENTPATLTHNSHVLLPPGRRISFKESETWNDGLLEKAYVNKKELNALLQEISKKLIKEKSVTLEGFGKLRRTKEGDVFFVMNKDLSVNPNGFGLVPLSMSPLPVSSRVKCATISPIQESSSQEDTLKEKDTSQKTAGAPKTKHVQKAKHRIGKGLLIFLVIILLLVVGLFLIYLFRDSLKPILEKILYSAEEQLLL